MEPTYVLYTVKSVIKYYNLHNSLVHTVHVSLTLLKLMFWYTRQELCIRWGAVISSFFTISNGVRQGRTLFPSLFTVYMDDVSSLLNTSMIGCHISDVCINYVFYADDLCFVAPSATCMHNTCSFCR